MGPALHIRHKPEFFSKKKIKKLNKNAKAKIHSSPGVLLKSGTPRSLTHSSFNNRRGYCSRQLFILHKVAEKQKSLADLFCNINRLFDNTI